MASDMLIYKRLDEMSEAHANAVLDARVVPVMHENKKFFPVMCNLETAESWELDRAIATLKHQKPQQQIDKILNPKRNVANVTGVVASTVVVSGVVAGGVSVLAFLVGAKQYAAQMLAPEKVPTIPAQDYVSFGMGAAVASLALYYAGRKLVDKWGANMRDIFVLEEARRQQHYEWMHIIAERRDTVSPK